MNGKFILYALMVSLVCTILSWGELADGGSGSASRSGSSWSSNSGSTGGSWGGGGGHK
ncbi:hypothetical protein [Noviherbaspirillum denitrificans]|uniref:hypothetical protein n=1 Tax=Noviherbaspirillum denitrificans TaxID=1968433 RepID=UPI001481FA8A|nr:hypothetical protein [Noviherbaspirillum denitrificans]